MGQNFLKFFAEFSPASVRNCLYARNALMPVLLAAPFGESVFLKPVPLILAFWQGEGVMRSRSPSAPLPGWDPSRVAGD